MSAWIAASSAPGALYAVLAGMIMAETARKSSRCRGGSALFGNMTTSIEQIGETLLHLIGDVERDGLDGRSRIDAARSDEQAAVDDEQVFDIVRPTPFVNQRGRGIRT